MASASGTHAQVLVTAQIPQTPPTKAVKLALFTNLRGIEELIAKIRSGGLDFAVLDARTIVSTTHLLAAVFRALNDQANGRMKTRNIHSEILLALNLNNNITEAYRKFGVQADTKSLVAIKIGSDDDEAVVADMTGVVQGDLVAANEENVRSESDISVIKKIYKITGAGAPVKDAAKGHPPEDERLAIETTVVESIALRGAT